MERMCHGHLALIVSLAVFFSAGDGGASDLSGINSGGDGKLFLSVSQVDGSTTTISNLASGRSYAGLAARPGSTGFLYTTSSTGTIFPCVSETRLEKISVGSGAYSPVADIDQAALGLPADYTLEATAIAISPNSPSTATLAGVAFHTSCDPLAYIFSVDLDTGAVLAPAVPLAESIESLTYSLDGATLYGGVGCCSVAKLVTVDPATGVITDITSGTPPPAITGLSFRPEDGALFATIGWLSDELVTISTSAGTVDSVLGPMGVLGPHGLAFRDTQSVPAMTPWGQGVLILPLLAVAMLTRSRRSGLVGGT